MKTIEIDGDVYDLLKQYGELGEPTSSILRRLFQGKVLAKHSGSASTTNNGISAPKRSDIYEALDNERFKLRRTAVDRFLFLLSWIHSKHPQTFSRVLELGGRSRRYFARTDTELDASGSSVNPQKIPNTEFWVVTNNDTMKKEQILQDVLRLNGYGPAEAAAVRGRLDPSGDAYHQILATL